MASSSGDQTIGYRYFMGLHMAVCHGPVDSIDQIYVGERSLDITPQSSSASIQVEKQALFGGDKKEGGIFGTVDFEFGEGTQTQNTYLVGQLGINTPAFRRVVCAVFRKSESSNPGVFASSSGGGYIAAMSPYPKPWAFMVTDIPGGGFNPTKQNINGSANGGHIIYDCLIDEDWGLGIPASNLDTTSFTAVTDTLFDEDFGLSFIYANQSSMKDFIDEVLNHINGVMYTDRSTGDMVLRLIRDDFDVGTLPVFDESNISAMIKFERPAFAEMVNEIVLKFRPKGAFKDASIAVQDLASVQAQGGVISQTKTFQGADTSVLASLIAQRELKQSSTPLARCSITANREAWDLNPGDVIKISWNAYGIVELVMRVIEVDYGSLQDGTIKIEMVEDIFGAIGTSYLNPVPTGWVEEVQNPEVAPSTRVIELPYFVIETTFAQEIINLLVSESAILQAITESISVAAFNVRLNTKTGINPYHEVSDGEFAPTALLDGALDRVTTTSISIKNFRGSVSAIVIGGYAYLNGEVLRIDSVDIVGGLMDVGRGYLDSIPQSHLLDDIIYFADSNDAQDPTIYLDGETIFAKALPQTSLGTLSIDDAAEDTLIMVGRRNKPYPPAQVQINGSYFPSAVDSRTVVVTWTHQDRTQQLVAAGDDWYNISLGSQEDGVLYTIQYYNEDTSTLLNTDADVSGLTSSFRPAGPIGTTFNMKVRISAVRDSAVLNLNTFEHIFVYTRPLEIRTLEDASVRTTENGDRRTME